MNAQLPSNTTTPGWPEFLHSREGGFSDPIQYVRVRDGTKFNEFYGAACLYAEVDENGTILKDHQYIPTSWTTADKPVGFSGGVWIDSPRLIFYGQPPLDMPKEPVDLPDDND